MKENQQERRRNKIPRLIKVVPFIRDPHVSGFMHMHGAMELMTSDPRPSFGRMMTRPKKSFTGKKNKTHLPKHAQDGS
jgi:hypothetical protein